MVSSARQPCSICMRLAHLTFVKQHCMFLVHKGQAVHPFAEQNRSSTPSLQKRSAPKDPSLAQPSQSFIADARPPTTMRASCSPALGCTRGVTRLRSRPVSYIVVGPGLSLIQHQMHWTSFSRLTTAPKWRPQLTHAGSVGSPRETYTFSDTRRRSFQTRTTSMTAPMRETA